LTRSGVPSSRITRAEPWIEIESASNGSRSQQISSFWPSSAPSSISPAVVIRHELVLLVEPSDLHAFIGKWLGAGAVARGNEVVRTAVKRHVEFRTGKARALDDRLEISRHESLRLARRAMRTGRKFCSKKGARQPRVAGFAAAVRRQVSHSAL